MVEPFAPRPVSNETRRISITDYVFPWRDGQPLWVNSHATTDIYLIVFSTEEKLRAHMTHVGLEFDSIKKIEEQREFLDSLPYRFPSGQRLRIAVDPWITERGTTRWTEILRGDA